MINNGIVLIKSPTWGCTWITVHQTHKLQRSSILKKLKQGKRLKEELHSSKVWRRRDLNSKINRSFPSKHLEFHSRQIHHRTQCGTARHKSMLWCPPNPANSKTILYNIVERRARIWQISSNSQPVCVYWIWMYTD